MDIGPLIIASTSGTKENGLAGAIAWDKSCDTAGPGAFCLGTSISFGNSGVDYCVNGNLLYLRQQGSSRDTVVLQRQ
jgi:hypothetical protein